MYSLQHRVVQPWWRRIDFNRLLDLFSVLLPWARRTTTVAAAACLVIIVVQLAYPRDRTLPLMYSSLGLGGVSADELSAQLENLNETRYQVGILGTGAMIDVPAAKQQLLDYSWGERLIPFSLLSSAGTDLPVSMTFNLVEPVGDTAAAPAQSGATNQQLIELIQQWQMEYPALQTSVSIQEIVSSGTARQASSNGDMLMPTASVFKLYLATYALKQIEAGALNPATQVVNGRDVNKCLELMIVNSDNTCGEALGAKLGWSKLQNYTKSLGLTTSKLNIVPLQSTANDSVKFLSQLSSGSLLSQPNTDLLLSYMGRQTYRKGIPAGATGATVYDKPGWDSSIANDIAIVRSPDANYLLAIYSNSRNALPLKDLSGRIQSLLSK